MSGPFVRPWVWFVILQDISERRDPPTGWLIDDEARYCEMTFMLPWGHSKTGVACQRWAAYNCRFCSAVFLVIVTLLKDIWVELTRVRRMMIGRLNLLRDWKQEKDYYWFPPFWSDLTFDTASSFLKEQSDHQRNVHRWCVVSSYQFTLFLRRESCRFVEDRCLRCMYLYDYFVASFCRFHIISVHLLVLFSMGNIQIDWSHTHAVRRSYLRQSITQLDQPCWDFVELVLVGRSASAFRSRILDGISGVRANGAKLLLRDARENSNATILSMFEFLSPRFCT